MIAGFEGYYSFLRNFYRRPLVYKGLQYNLAESAYQAQKCLYEEDKLLFVDIMKGKEAKKLGRSVVKVDNWDSIKARVMYEIVKAKFEDYELRVKLVTTGDEELIEVNTWHDNYFGFCICQDCRGKEHRNMLGKALMAVRADILKELQGGQEIG